MSANKGAAVSALDFHRTTYADAAMLSDWAMLPVDQWPDEWFTYNEKSFPRLERVQLQVPEAPPSGLGREWLARRASSRTALDQMSLAALSQVLWYTTHSDPPEEYAPGSWHRPYPSMRRAPRLRVLRHRANRRRPSAGRLQLRHGSP